VSQADVVLVDWLSRLRDRRTGHKLPVARFTRVLVGGDKVIKRGRVPGDDVTLSATLFRACPQKFCQQGHVSVNLMVLAEFVIVDLDLLRERPDDDCDRDTRREHCMGGRKIRVGV